MTVKEYCEQSLKECDEYKAKWEKVSGFEHAATIFEGMAEAYYDLLHKIEIGELT